MSSAIIVIKITISNKQVIKHGQLGQAMMKQLCKQTPLNKIDKIYKSSM